MKYCKFGDTKEFTYLTIISEEDIHLTKKKSTIPYKLLLKFELASIAYNFVQKYCQKYQKKTYKVI